MIKFAVLGLLLEKPHHGYAVRAEFDRRLGDLWELNYGQVYQILTSLEEAGYVSAFDERIGRRPPRKVYSITPKGRDALRSWLARPTARVRPYRDEFFVRLMLSGHFGAESMPRVIQAQIQKSCAHLRELVNLREARCGGSGHEATVGRLVVEAAILHAEADLKALDLCREVLVEVPELGRQASQAERDRASRGVRQRVREGGER